jgi:hypothetical protein
MKKIGFSVLYIVTIVILTEFLFWTTTDILIFNTVFLNYGLKLFYYGSASIIALILSFFLALFYNKIPVICRYLLFVLSNTYIILSIIQLSSNYCEEVKNINTFYTIIISSFLFFTVYFIIFKIISKMKLIGLFTVAVSTLILIIDFEYLLVGFKIFYPSFW